MSKLVQKTASQWLRMTLLAGLIVGCQPAAESQEAPHRIVVIGDLHADIGVTRQAFQLAGAIDENDNWIGGDLTIVQLGDFIGRSDDDREVLDFMFAVRDKAEAGGGKVHNLIGNHEVFGARVDNQAVGRGPFAAFEGMEGLDLNDPRLQRLPEYQRARGAALMSGGPYARRLAEFPAVLKLGETIYVHAGVLPRWAEYGIDRINNEVREWFLGNTSEPNSTRGVDNGDKVMWTRQLSYDVGYFDCTVLDDALDILNAKRMVVAHTVRPEITNDCEGKLWAIDVGMSRAYGGAMQLLEIIDDDEVTVIRP